MEARLASWEFTFHITVPARWGVRGSVPRFHSQFYTVKMIFHASWRVFHFNNATFQYFSSRAQLKFSLFVSPELTAKRSRWWLSILFINTHLSTLFRCCFWYNIIHFSLSLSIVSNGLYKFLMTVKNALSESIHTALLCGYFVYE